MRASLLRSTTVVGLLLLAACNDKSTNENSTTTSTTDDVSGADIPLGTEQAVHAIDSIALTYLRDKPHVMMIRVTGTVRTAGWTDAKLLEIRDSTGNATVKSYRFVATSPKMRVASRSSQPAAAMLRVESFPLNVKTVRVVAEANEISAAVPFERPVHQAADSSNRD